MEEERCSKLLHEFAEVHKRMPAYIGSVGMFNDTKTIFVAPMMNNAMYGFQREIHEYLHEFDKSGWEWYCPNQWVPHCTIALTDKDEENAFYKASDLILHEFEKLSGQFSSMGLVKISFPVQEVCNVVLG